MTTTPGADYMREYRANNPDVLQRQRKLQAASGKALRALRDKHRREYDRLLTRFKQEVGLVD